MSWIVCVILLHSLEALRTYVTSSVETYDLNNELNGVNAFVFTIFFCCQPTFASWLLYNRFKRFLSIYFNSFSIIYFRKSWGKSKNCGLKSPSWFPSSKRKPNIDRWGEGTGNNDYRTISFSKLKNLQDFNKNSWTCYWCGGHLVYSRKRGSAFEKD